MSLLTLARIPFAALLAARSWLRLTFSRSALTRVALTRLVRWFLAGRLPLVRRVLTGLAVASAATFACTVAAGLCLPRLHSIGRVVAGLPAVIENPLHRLAVIGPISSHRRAGLLTPALLTPACLVAHSALVAGLLPLGCSVCTAGPSGIIARLPTVWPLRRVLPAPLLAARTVPSIGLFAVRLSACATLPLIAAASSRAVGSASFSSLPLRGALLLVLSGLRLLAALLTAAGGAALLPRLGFALLAAVLLWLALLRLALLCSTRFLAIRWLLLLAALLPLLSFCSVLRSLFSLFRLLSPLLLLHGAFAALRCSLPATLARCTAVVFRSLARLTFAIFLLLILLLLLLARPRRHLLGLPRRRRGIDLQQLPRRMRHVRLAGPRIDGHATVFERASSPRPEPLWHELQAAVKRATPLTARQHDLRLCRPTLHPGLKADAGQTKVGVERPHPHRHRCPRRHAGRRFQRLLDRDLGGQVCLHLNPVFELLGLHLPSTGERRAARLEDQSV